MPRKLFMKIKFSVSISHSYDTRSLDFIASCTDLHRSHALQRAASSLLAAQILNDLRNVHISLIAYGKIILCTLL